MCVNPITTRDGQSYACGKCNKCHTRYLQHWVFRLQQEMRVTNKSVFLTLTYNYESLPLHKGKFTLRKEDYQKFLKRLRKLTDNTLKYVVCGEYGDKNGRPHYHMILFGLDVTDFKLIEKAWGLGHIHVGTVEPASIAYVFKYSIKGDKKIRDWRQKKQFVAMSKGLGEKYAFNIAYQLETYVNKNGNTYVRKKKIRTPKPFFDNKLQTLVDKPYMYTVAKGQTYKMSVPRFYLKAANYDTTELTEKYLDKMQTKYDRFTDAQKIVIVERAQKQVQASIKQQERDVLYSIAKEKL